jgi:hypothetical protein
LRAFARNADLRGGDVDGRDQRSREPSQVNRERSPAGADLGDRHAWTQVQFSRDPLELVQLRLLDRFVLWILEESTGVVQPFVQEQTVDLGVYIVMVARVGGGEANRIGLVPPPHRSPDLSKQAL